MKAENKHLETYVVMQRNESLPVTVLNGSNSYFEFLCSGYCIEYSGTKRECLEYIETIEVNQD
jgi:hypothetical protein